MHTTYFIILVFSVALFASLFTLGAYALFSKLANVDEPDARSNHSAPTVTGVGMGFMVAIISFLVVVNSPTAMVIGAIVLLIVSIMDDRRPLKASMRFGFQLISVIVALHVFDGNVFQGFLPVWADMAVTVILWLWMINLTNFMDGIDEITVIETTSITGGLLLLSLIFSVIPQPITVDALVIAIGVFSFYPWNRHPAKCFMGDSGSVPLGYLLGYLLLALASKGFWEVALILPAYYVSDASLTLAKRALARKVLWQAHSEHFYQKAVRSGRSHHWVAMHVLILNIALLLLAGLALYLPSQAVFALMAAYALSCMTCLFFATRGQVVTRMVSHGVSA